METGVFEQHSWIHPSAAEAGGCRVEAPSAPSGADQIAAFVFNLRQESSRLELYFIFLLGTCILAGRSKNFIKEESRTPEICR